MGEHVQSSEPASPVEIRGTADYRAERTAVQNYLETSETVLAERRPSEMLLAEGGYAQGSDRTLARIDAMLRYVEEFPQLVADYAGESDQEHVALLSARANVQFVRRVLDRAAESGS